MTAVRTIQLAHYGIFREEHFIRVTPEKETSSEVRVDSYPKTSNEECQILFVKKVTVTPRIIIENASDPKKPLEILDETNVRVVERRVVLSETEALSLLGLDEESAPSRRSTSETISVERQHGINTRFYLKNIRVVLGQSQDFDQLIAALPEPTNPEYGELYRKALEKKPTDEMMRRLPEFQMKLSRVLSETFKVRSLDDDFMMVLNKRWNETSGMTEIEAATELLDDVNKQFFGSAV